LKLYSRHFFDKGIDVPTDAVVRVNLAWDSKKIPDNHDLFFDYPLGRKKPPYPAVILKEAIELANSHPRAKYFAVSRAEKGVDMEWIRKRLRIDIKLVPKIETGMGVNNLYQIVEGADTDMIMLDTEDLFADADDLYEDYTRKFNDMVRFGAFHTGTIGIKVLRLQGVVFCDY